MTAPRMDDAGPATAWALAIAAISNALGVSPLPAGITEATVGHWSMKLNNGREAAGDLEPFGIELASNEYLAFGVLTPAGGMLGGWSEDRFILEMAEHLSADDRETFAAEIAAASPRIPAGEGVGRG